MFKQRNIKIFTFLAILFFFASYITYQIQLPAAEDLPRLIKNGEMILKGEMDVFTKNVYSYTEPNQPFANHHWLSGVVFYLLHDSVGYTGIDFFKILVFLSIFSLLFHIALRKADFWVVALVSLPTVLILIGRSAARPEMFSYLFIVLFIYLLTYAKDHPESKRIYWLIPLQILWTNMHLFFGVGVMLVGGFFVERLISNFKNLKSDTLFFKLSGVLAIVILAIFITPYGIKGAVYSLQVNMNRDFPISSSETQSVASIAKTVPPVDNLQVTIFPYVVYILLLSFLARFYGATSLQKVKQGFKEFPIFYFLASVGTVLVGYKVVRSLPMFGLIFLPAASMNLNFLFLKIKDKLYNRSAELKKILKIVTAIVFLVLLMFLTFFARKTISPYQQIGVGLAPRSLDSIKFFKDNNLKGPIFNDTDIGSYLIGELYPEEKVFVDNRFGDAYSHDFFGNVYLPMSNDEDVWAKMSEKYKINTIFFYQYDGGGGARDFLYRRIYDPTWAWVYADYNVVILVKNIPENKEVIDKFQITAGNIKEKLNFLESSPNIIDKLGAADLYSLVGLSDMSSDVYLKIVSEKPERGKIWMILGSIELTKANQEDSNPNLALVYMQRAIDEGWTTPEAYSYLALAYYRTGDVDKAKEMVNKQLKIDPDNQDGKNWLDRFDKDEFPDSIDEKKLYEQSRQ